ncbi:family 10 glycosylhydrolase [Chondrinema litorale]|uniref:family 10 glycosylhydrolase n=1 Tax=Chondrinema litorale TaxID=2994555 RepID=UPI002543B870|nr:family 10 glycosylhydrolase [Chondrinema litorale]UZR94001.1 family 10 glycosylhydrolase [Chondrinema litorale]
MILLLNVTCSYSYDLSAEIDTFPKREFRGVWVATVNNIDWPSKSSLSSNEQKQEFKELVKYCKKLGINAMIVQIRASGDAFYQSELEPWSHWLTGKQGKQPEEFYDPLEYMIQVCHNENIEFHAWINPFRSVQSSRMKLSENHIFNKKPEWHFRYNGMQILNPGIPAVRNYICTIIQDIVRRYDVDAVHFDDYFYPYPVKGEKINDAETFKKYNSQNLNLDDWRRENINQFIFQVSEVINQTKSEVKFGISPPGIWRNAYKDPEGSATKGLSSFDDIYADSRLWIKNAWIDYIIPQIYWNISHKIADYKTITEWWENNSYHSQIYIGHAAYKMDQDQIRAWKDGKEIDRQIENNRRFKNISGSAFFSISSLIRNSKNFADSLKSKYYKQPALLPAMAWLDSIPPNAPIHLKKIKTDQGWMLSWQESPIAFDGDTAKGYLLYRFPDTLSFDTEDTNYLIQFLTVDQKNYHDTNAGTKNYNYLLTAYDRLNNESTASFQIFDDTTSVEVKNVVVALNKAQVDASVRINLEKGSNKIILKNLPKSIIEGSLVFKTSHNEEITLVKLKSGQVKESTKDSASIYLQNKILEIEKEISILNDSITVFENAEQILMKNQQLAADKTNVDEIRKLEQYFSYRFLELKQKSRNFNSKLESLKAKSNYLQNRLNEINITETDSLLAETQIAEIDILSPTKRVSEIEMSYQVKNVDWLPEYNLFYNKFTDNLKIQYKANIHQQSGQHWINIPVSVSSEFSNSSKDSSNLKTPSIFRVAPQNVSIFSNIQKQAVSLGEDKPNFKSELIANADINSSPNILLSIFDATTYEWFPGKMNVFLNDQLQQKLTFQPEILKDTVTLNLGKDTEVQIRKMLKRDSRKNFVLFKKINQQYVITLRNSKSKKVTVQLVSKPKYVLTKKKRTKLFNEANNNFNYETQKFEWQLEIPAGKTIDLTFGYEFNQSIFKKQSDK